MGIPKFVERVGDRVGEDIGGRARVDDHPVAVGVGDVAGLAGLEGEGLDFNAIIGVYGAVWWAAAVGRHGRGDPGWAVEDGGGEGDGAEGEVAAGLGEGEREVGRYDALGVHLH